MSMPLLIESLWSDVKFSSRSLLKSPGFLLVVVLSLALGIAANSTIFSVLNAVLFRPLPYPQSENLVAIWQTDLAQPDSRQAPPIAEVTDWLKQNHVFEDISLSGQTDNNTANTASGPRILHSQSVTPNFFHQLGAEPVLGRVFRADESQDLTQSIVISTTFWQREYHSDPQVLGKTIELEGNLSTIVGVMPAGFAPFFGAPVDLWEPINPESPRYAARQDHWLMPVARLKPGVTLAQAQGEMDIIARRLEQQYPDINKGWGKRLIPLHQQLFGWAGPALYPLLGAVMFVLLIACVNVANLLQFRTETRRREYALRVSLGAGRSRLIRQLLTESALLSLTGAALGIFLTFAGIKLFLALAGDFPNSANITVNPPVLLFTLGISVTTAIIFGLAPALQASRPDLNVVLRQSERKTTTLAATLARNALAISEVALAVVLLVGAGLMINSMLRLHRVNSGFDSSNLLTFEFQLPEGGKYVERVPGGDMEHTTPAVTAFYKSILEKASALPGVQAAGLAGSIPSRCCSEQYSFAILGQPTPTPENRPRAGYSETSPQLLSTLRVPLIKGRYLDEHDAPGAPWAIVVNQTFVRKFLPNQDPIGQQILLRYDPYPVDEQQPRQIVGVVGDVKHFGPAEDAPPYIYSSYLQQPAVFPGGSARAHLHQGLILRAAPGFLRGQSSLVTSVKQVIAEVDSAQPVSSIMTMDEILALSIGDWRFYMELLGVFAGVAVLLAAVGIYGVMSYSVNERTHEFGVRMALGALHTDLLGLVAKLALKLTAIGLLIGTALALGLTRLITTFLYGVKPTDPLTYAAVALAIAAVVALACYLPARRASKVDPLVALRYE
jgi:putative ABC transport system permease protein